MWETKRQLHIKKIENKMAAYSMEYKYFVSVLVLWKLKIINAMLYFRLMIKVSDNYEEQFELCLATICLITSNNWFFSPI